MSTPTTYTELTIKYPSLDQLGVESFVERVATNNLNPSQIALRQKFISKLTAFIATYKATGFYHISIDEESQSEHVGLRVPGSAMLLTYDLNFDHDEDVGDSWRIDTDDPSDYPRSAYTSQLRDLARLQLNEVETLALTDRAQMTREIFSKANDWKFQSIVNGKVTFLRAYNKQLRVYLDQYHASMEIQYQLENPGQPSHHVIH